MKESLINDGLVSFEFKNHAYDLVFILITAFKLFIMSIDFVIGNTQDNFHYELAKALKCTPIGFSNRYHPDGEPSPVIEADYSELGGSNVLLAYRTKQLPTRDIIARHMHNIGRVLNNLTDPETFNVKSVDVLYPYYILGRQDHNARTDASADVRERDKGKDLGYKYAARLFKGFGARRIITFNPHFCRRAGDLTVCGLDVISLSGVKSLARYAGERGDLSSDALILGPDCSSSMLAEEFASLVGREYFHCDLTKERESSSSVTFSGAMVDFNGKDIVIVDDIASTLGTIKRFIEKTVNAGSIDVYVVSAVLPQEGMERLQQLLRGNVRRFIATDAVKSDFSHASIIPEVVECYTRFND